MTHILKPRNVGVTAFVKDFFNLCVGFFLFKKEKAEITRRITLYWDNVSTQRDMLARIGKNVFI